MVIILGIAGLPAIFEELAFRERPPALAHPRHGPRLGILFTSIIFSAIHFQSHGFLSRVLLGALFGWMAHRSGSLLPGKAHRGAFREQCTCRHHPRPTA